MGQLFYNQIIIEWSTVILTPEMMVVQVRNVFFSSRTILENHFWVVTCIKVDFFESNQNSLYFCISF